MIAKQKTIHELKYSRFSSIESLQAIDAASSFGQIEPTNNSANEDEKENTREELQICMLPSTKVLMIKVGEGH